jgi:transcriptional regulator with XRE-family HTH domain
MSIGAKVKQRRIELGFSQVELAKMAGIKQPSLSYIENHPSQSIKQSTLVRLAAALQIAPEELYEEPIKKIINISKSSQMPEIIDLEAKLNSSNRSKWISYGFDLLDSQED